MQHISRVSTLAYRGIPRDVPRILPHCAENIGAHEVDAARIRKLHGNHVSARTASQFQHIGHPVLAQDDFNVKLPEAHTQSCHEPLKNIFHSAIFVSRKPGRYFFADWNKTTQALVTQARHKTPKMHLAVNNKYVSADHIRECLSNILFTNQRPVTRKIAGVINCPTELRKVIKYAYSLRARRICWFNNDGEPETLHKVRYFLNGGVS